MFVASPDIRQHHREDVQGIDHEGHHDGSEQIRAPQASRKGQSTSPGIRQLQCEDTEDMENTEDMESELQQKRNKKTEVTKPCGLCFKSYLLV